MYSVKVEAFAHLLLCDVATCAGLVNRLVDCSILDERETFSCLVCKLVLCYTISVYDKYSQTERRPRRGWMEKCFCGHKKCNYFNLYDYQVTKNRVPTHC